MALVPTLVQWNKKSPSRSTQATNSSNRSRRIDLKATDLENRKTYNMMILMDDRPISWALAATTLKTTRLIEIECPTDLAQTLTQILTRPRSGFDSWLYYSLCLLHRFKYSAKGWSNHMNKTLFCTYRKNHCPRSASRPNHGATLFFQAHSTCSIRMNALSFCTYLCLWATAYCRLSQQY